MAEIQPDTYYIETEGNRLSNFVEQAPCPVYYGPPVYDDRQFVTVEYVPALGYTLKFGNDDSYIGMEGQAESNATATLLKDPYHLELEATGSESDVFLIKFKEDLYFGKSFLRRPPGAPNMLASLPKEYAMPFRFIKVPDEDKVREQHFKPGSKENRMLEPVRN